MRRHTLAVVAVLLVLAPPSYAGGWMLEDYLRDHPRSDWEGHGVGTMVHRRQTSTTSAPGMPAPMETVSETKETLVRITETDYVIKTETLVNGQWMASERTEPKHDGRQPTVVDAGEETVTVGGTPYACQKKKITWSGDDGADEVVLWVHEDAGVLRLTLEGHGGLMTVTELDATWTVGDHTLKGRVVSLESDQGAMGRTTGTMHMCRDVPGALVRHEMSGKRGPATFQVVNELVAFVKR